MKASIYSKEGKKKGELVLNPAIYANRVNHRLLELVQKAYSGNLRRGTASTKVRKEVRGGGKKPWRQKGTGRARHSSIRSPLWRGGGVVFGPHPRKYVVSLPKGMRAKAIISALSLKGEQKNLMLIEDVKLESPKTREWANIIGALPLHDKKSLCVVKDIEPNLKRASQNLESKVKIQRVQDLNAYHILRYEIIIIEQEALPSIEERVLGLKRKEMAGEGTEETV